MQPCDAAFKKHVRFRCFEALQREGFVRFRKESVDWPLDDNFHFWLGLNTGLKPNYIEINPFVGLHVVQIGRLIALVQKTNSKSKYHREYATYAIHIGEIAPRERVVRFTRETDIDAEATRLAKLCVAMGLPFAKSIASYEKLLPLLDQRVHTLGEYPERVACCLYLMGRIADSYTFAKNFLIKEPKYFEQFAIPFIDMLDRNH
jgi:hypothetical protein